MDGILNIRKEKGFTSHDVVVVLRGILHTKKIGHTGTLDPMAEGVLPVCVGAATKLCETFTDHDKEYTAVMRLGEVYDTLDITGVMLERREVMLTKEEVASAINSFIGGYNQVPPMYSAKKIDGKKLYELARAGKTVERKPVFVDIYDIEILELDIPKVTIRVHCGKGTYIRSLISDIGDKLSCGACMESLTRTRVGEFDIKNSYSLDEIKKVMEEDKISDVILSIEEVFGSLEEVNLNTDLSKAALNGNALKGRDMKKIGIDTKDMLTDGQRVRIYADGRKFVAIYEYRKADDILKVYKMFL